MMGTEVEVDAICDGERFVIPGIMEHVERAGVHSGDSISVYPAQHLSKRIIDTIVDYTGKLAFDLKVRGLVNIQYVVYRDQVYVIEVNPRSSRTIPYISKVTGVPMVDIATRVMMGISLKEQGYESGLMPNADHVAVKVPVFSFEKLNNVDNQLGPEMKSTGEVLGVAKTLEEALLKGLAASGQNLVHSGGVLFTVRDSDKAELIPIAEKFHDMGFELYATSGTAYTLNKAMIPTSLATKISENRPGSGIDLIEQGKIQYVISTSTKGRDPHKDSVRLRRKAVERGIVCLTSLDTANALADCIAMKKTIGDVELVDITTIPQR